MQRKWYVPLTACVVALCLLLPGPPPAQAMSPRNATTLAYSLAGGVLGLTAGYIMWVNRPANQDKMSWEVKGPGGFFFGGFMGASFVEANAWQPLRGRVDPIATLPYDVHTSNLGYTAGVVGGLKAGYFFHQFPYLGLELAGDFTRNDIRHQTVTLSRPVLGQTRAVIPQEDFATLTLALHFLARYGFLKDQEVPFGRLQPYVGIGPALVILWGDVDAAKNFALSAVGGVRYMLRKNLSVFMEYKFSHQWEVELEHSKIRPLGTFQERRGTAVFDWTTHKVVAGITVHFW